MSLIQPLMDRHIQTEFRYKHYKDLLRAKMHRVFQESEKVFLNEPFIGPFLGQKCSDTLQESESILYIYFQHNPCKCKANRHGPWANMCAFIQKF